MEAHADLKERPIPYQIRPAFKRMFKPTQVKAIIRQVLETELKDKKYNPAGDSVNKMTRHIAFTVKQKLKGEKSLPFVRLYNWEMWMESDWNVKC
eukprot:1371480-Amorphochlora_amoeboformis.AAC.1